MRAIVVSELGGPEVMVAAERSDPVAGPGQVVVKVAAAGVNFIDLYRRSGVYQQPVPYMPGIEGAGVITAVAGDVTGFKPVPATPEKQPSPGCLRDEASARVPW
jgi:NADPH2:quinone reductase